MARSGVEVVMDVGETIGRRRSCRAYAPKDVSRTLLEQVLEAARLAPSACNQQPWRFAVVMDQQRRTQVVEKGFRAGLPMRWAKTAPVLIVLGIKRSLVVHRAATHVSKVDYPWIDAGIAGEHLVLQAEALGLGTCWIGWIHPTRLRTVVGWPRDITPAAVITLGWPDDPSHPPAARPRKELKDLVTWLPETAPPQGNRV